ncbi:MAG TPA: ATP-binding protein, partial [Mycobacteriales bacterium]|nr:ATP-binding protein [Mycobacteriales bacterium]
MGSPVRLAADASAARHARRVVAAALAQPEQEDMRDTAALLVSELVTNSIVHAASAVELEVDADGDSVTVRVRDADTGPLVMRAGGGSELDEGGRGLLLVDRLAQAWGTEHHAGRKTVWFRIARADSAPRATVTSIQPPPVAEAAPVGDRLLHRLLLPPKAVGALTFDEHVGELLLRVMDAVGAAGAVLTLTVGDGTVVGRGEQSAPTVESAELVVEDRPLGTLEMRGHGPLDADGRAFVALAAALTAFRNGDFAVRLGRRDGLLGDVVDRFNELADQQERRTRELVRVSHVIGREGRMTERLSELADKGDWAASANAVNSLIDDLVRPTTEVARVIEAVA